MEKNYLIKISIFGIYLTTFIISTVFMFTVPSTITITYGLTTETEDGVTIAFNVFEPRNIGLGNKKAIVIGHGSMANKEMMKGYAIELANAGFLAVAFDFRGHGLSTGSRGEGELTNDIEAIKLYLQLRGDIDIHNLGYIGLSMGGIGQAVIAEDFDFKCFIGTATWLYPDLRKGNLTNPLNVLMIHAQYDEILRVESLKESLSQRVNVPVENILLNRLYGSFLTGNASKIYLDDNSNHIFSQWDTDFHREARNWVINTFPNVKPASELFFGHIRLIILIIQVFSGLALFFSIISPTFNVLFKEEELTIINLELRESTPTRFAIEMVLFSLVLALPGILIMLIVNLVLPLAIEGFVISLFFGPALALWILVWKSRSNKEISFLGILKTPFQRDKRILAKEFVLGFILALLLFFILYISIGLNYLAIVPSITKILWVPIYFALTFFTFLLYQLTFQFGFANKLSEVGNSMLIKTLVNFGVLFLYLFVYMYIISMLIRSFFYFGFMIPVGIPVFLLISYTQNHLYEKNGNIISGTMISSFFFVMFVSTSAQLQMTIVFIINLVT